MARTLIALAVGFVIGATAAWSIRKTAIDDFIPELIQPAPQARDTSGLEEKLSRANDRVRELSTELAAARRALDTASAQTQADRILRMADNVSRTSTDTDDVVERLLAGGFSPQRADWIGQRLDELLLDMIAQRNEALRDDASGATLPELTAYPDTRLREDLGDYEYEQYLLALGREPNVQILDVIDSSPAAMAGLQAGDRIVYYDGRRVFDFLEITPLTLDGDPGEIVVVDILRDGEPIQLAVPRGPLGVRLTAGRTLTLEPVRSP